MQFVVVEGGELYAPSPRGVTNIACAGTTILEVGNVSSADLERFEVERIDASGCIVTPGLIDPHAHLLGGSGEEGFATQTPEVFASELLLAGITTVAGLLGTDTTTRTLPALLGKVKALRDEGLGAFMWTGGYDVPPKSLTGSVRDDVILIDEIIGVGETAIADLRAMEPTARELARLATDCYIAGTLTGKAGVLLLHVGDAERRLALLREVIEQYDVVPATFYPTHVERNEELMGEALEITRRGVPIDLDVFELDLVRWMAFAAARDADLTMITASTDTGINAPRTLLAQVAACVREGVLELEDALSLATRNTARILKLRDRLEVRAGARADLLVLDRDSFALRHVICGGEVRVRDGTLVRGDRFLQKSNREIQLRGAKANDV